MNNILRYEGKASLAMIGLTSGAILNIIGDPILIFGCNMGMAGAGLSTAVSQYISSIILYCMFLKGKTTSRFSIKNVTRDLRDVIEILKNGFPSLTRQGLSCVSTTMLNQFAGFYKRHASCPAFLFPSFLIGKKDFLRCRAVPSWREKIRLMLDGAPGYIRSNNRRLR